EACGDAGDLRRKANPLVSEVVIVILDDAGEMVGERIFAAYADGPSRSCVGRRVSRSNEDRRSRIVDALPSAPDLDVAKQAIPRVANAPCYRRQRVDVAVIENA